MNYDDLIARKSAAAPASGFQIAESALAAHLYPHQRDLVRWAARRGRAAIFADTGLGKGPMLLEWASHVSQHGRVLVLAPLAVGPQLEREGRKFGVEAAYRRTDDGSRILITNYEMLHAFDPGAFVGVVLDESSILKSFDGATRTALIQAFRATPYRLCCTATPAPNDFTELGNHSEFLGLKSRAEMLAEFFVHDGGSTQDWRIKGHAVQAFWRWVATWGAVVKMPSDLGYDDAAFTLPPLRMVEHVVPATAHDIAATGQLFALQARTLQEQRAAKRATIESRANRIAEIIRAAPADEQFLVWCELNDEQDTIAKLLGEICVSIAGATPDDDKVSMVERWLAGGVRTAVSKVKILGWGLNFQHCHRVIFAGPSNSYEGTYQAIRRCWRFGQRSEVIVDVVRSELDEAIVENYRRKSADAEKMAAEMTAHVGEAVRAEVRGLSREFNPYLPGVAMTVPSWCRTEMP